MAVLISAFPNKLEEYFQKVSETWISFNQHGRFRALTFIFFTSDTAGSENKTATRGERESFNIRKRPFQPQRLDCFQMHLESTFDNPIKKWKTLVRQKPWIARRMKTVNCASIRGNQFALYFRNNPRTVP